jgi:hypothetical protein
MTISIPNCTFILLCQSTTTNNGSYWKVGGKGITLVNWFRQYSIWWACEGFISSFLLSTLEPFKTTLICKLGHLCNCYGYSWLQRACTCQWKLNYIHVGQRTNAIDFERWACDYVFMNAKRSSLPTRVGNPNFQTFDSGGILLSRANVQMFNSIEAIGPKYGVGCGSWPRFTTFRWVKTHVRIGCLLPWNYYVTPIT